MRAGESAGESIINKLEKSLADKKDDEFRKLLCESELSLSEKTRLAHLVEKSELSTKLDKRKIAILNSFTATNIKTELFIEGIKLGFYLTIDFGGYDQYLFELLNKDSFVYQSQYDFILVLTDSATTLNMEFEFLDKKKEEVIALIDEKLSHLEQALSFAKANTKAMIIVSNLVVPPYSVFGLHETKTELGYQEAIQQYNEKLRAQLKKDNNFYLLDMDSLMARIGKDNMTDNKYYYIGKILLNEKAARVLSREAASIFASSLGKTKKCLVMDLDNTIWGGVVGEVGTHGITLSDEGVGLAYKNVQRIILNLFKRGIILAVVSKNNPDDAFGPFKENKNMVLQEKHIAVFKVNWKDKASNIVEVANELNIGIDSLVFLDDNPAERGLVKHMLPQVEVIDFPEDISELPDVLRKMKFFDKIFMTEEDKSKGEMYAQDGQRKQFKLNFNDEKDYLRQLEIGMEIEKLDKPNIQRITELINKTNQFNLRTKRVTISEMEACMKNPDYKIYCCRTSDKFGDQGIVGVIVLKHEKNNWFIENYLLSCRILARGIEHEFLYRCIHDLKSEVVGEYIPTPKNPMVKDFYVDVGFEKLERQNNTFIYRPESTKLKRSDWITVKIK